MNEFIDSCTDNFADQKEKMSQLSIANLVRVYDYINLLSQFVPKENEVLDDLDNVIEPLVDIIVDLRDEGTCPHCGSYLYKSDLPQYDYVCVTCDENF